MTWTSRPPTSAILAAVASSVRNRPIPADDGDVRRGRAGGRGARHRAGAAAHPGGGADGIPPARPARGQHRSRPTRPTAAAASWWACGPSARLSTPLRLSASGVPAGAVPSGSDCYIASGERPAYCSTAVFIRGVAPWPGSRSRGCCSPWPSRTWRRCCARCRSASLANAGFGLDAGRMLVSLFESRLRETPRVRACSASLSAARSAWRSRGRSALGSVLGRHRRSAVEFLHSFMLIVLPYLGLVLGAQARRVARAGPAGRPLPRDGPQRRYKILDTSVIIDGRIADVCETGFIDGTLVDPAVRPEGAAARRRLVRLAEAEPRPPRPRHPAEDPEDGRASR